MTSHRQRTLSRRPLFRAPFARLILLTFFLSSILVGCSRNKHILEIDNRYSMNVIRTPIWFPGPKDVKLTDAQTEVLFRNGPPDYIRLWWRDDGSFITSSDLSGRDPELLGQELHTMDKSWIYMAKKEEYVFLRNAQSYRIQPVGELLEMICRYGDPSSRSAPRIIDGELRETWQWIEHGLQVEIIEGKPGKTTYFPATGQGTWGLK